MSVSCDSMSKACDRYLSSAGKIGIVAGKNTKAPLQRAGLKFNEI